MAVAGGGFEQAYNAQATVASGSLLVVTNDVVQAANDKQQIAPALEGLAQLPDELGKAGTPWNCATPGMLERERMFALQPALDQQWILVRVLDSPVGHADVILRLFLGRHDGSILLSFEPFC